MPLLPTRSRLGGGGREYTDLYFLVADVQLYRNLCVSVNPSGYPLIYDNQGQNVKTHIRDAAELNDCLCVSMWWEGIWIL